MNREPFGEEHEQDPKMPVRLGVLAPYMGGQWYTGRGPARNSKIRCVVNRKPEITDDDMIIIS